MDSASAMELIGDVGRYAKFQAGGRDAPDASPKSLWWRRLGAGLGAGFAVGNAMVCAMGNAITSRRLDQRRYW